MVHDPRLDERPGLLADVLRAAALPVEVARLRGELRRRLEEVEESRARIVRAGDEERRRLERDLHDGAQQRLVALGMALRRVQRRVAGDPEAARALDGAVDEVAEAVRDLREIARGLRPGMLDDGLGPALADLARRTPLAVDVEAPADRAPAEIETAAYYVVSEALANAVKHAEATRVSVTRAPARRPPRRARRGRRPRRRRPGARRRAGRARGPHRGPRRPHGAGEPPRRGDAPGGGAAVRIVIGEDSTLFREGLVLLLRDAGHEVVAAVGDADALEAAVAREAPDLAIADIRMPPGDEDAGARAAARIRRDHPGVAVMLLSQHVETRHSLDLVAAGGFGYLLKDRVLDVDDFLDALRRVADGGSALDPEVVAALVGPRRDDPLDVLTPREREVLGLMAEGRTNAGIARRLWLTDRTVETHVSSILGKLGIAGGEEDHRRVLAVLAHLRAST